MNMTKIRFAILLLTLIIVGSALAVAGLFARGYRLDFKTFKFVPNGILVAKSNPDGAQIFVDGELRTATNATIPLGPGTYDISIRKEGYLSWNKRLLVEKEVVTEADAHLFRVAPSLSAITFSSAVSPVATDDSTKIAYIVPPGKENTLDKVGLWVIDTVNLPLGFSKDPRRVTDGDLTKGSWQWSPDGREILLTMPTGVFLLDAGTFTPQTRWVNVASQKSEILKDWEIENETRLTSLLRNIPDSLAGLLKNSKPVYFSPDETKILYTASESATIPENLIKPLPGASTQPQERNIKEGLTYVYDIKEDRNFLIERESERVEECKTQTPAIQLSCSSTLTWFPTSRHLVLAEPGRVVVMDYDGTNRQIVYSGSYETPFAFPTLNSDRILILTNLGAGTSFPNLYSLGLK